MRRLILKKTIMQTRFGTVEFPTAAVYYRYNLLLSFAFISSLAFVLSFLDFPIQLSPLIFLVLRPWTEKHQPLVVDPYHLFHLFHALHPHQALHHVLILDLHVIFVEISLVCILIVLFSQYGFLRPSHMSLEKLGR